MQESFKQFTASDIASAIIYISRQELGIFPTWNRKLRDLTRGSDPTSQILSRIIHRIKVVMTAIPPEPAHDDHIASFLPSHNDIPSSPEGKENCKGSVTIGMASPVSITSSDVIDHDTAL